MAFRYMRPDEFMTLNGSIVTSVESTYQAAWLCDGRPGYPFKSVSSTVSAVVVGTSRPVSAYVVGNHNVYNNSITITGGAPASLAAPTTRANSIQRNPWTEISTATISSFNLAITNNAAGKIIIGELFAGPLRRTTFGLQQRSVDFDFDAGVIDLDAEFDAQTGYDKGTESRILTGIFRANAQDQLDLEAWWESTRGSTLPSVIIPDETVNDAWIVKFDGFRKRMISYQHAEIAVRFREYSRSRW